MYVVDITTFIKYRKILCVGVSNSVSTSIIGGLNLNDVWTDGPLIRNPQNRIQEPLYYKIWFNNLPTMHPLRHHRNTTRGRITIKKIVVKDNHQFSLQDQHKLKGKLSSNLSSSCSPLLGEHPLYDLDMKHFCTHFNWLCFSLKTSNRNQSIGKTFIYNM